MRHRRVLRVISSAKPMNRQNASNDRGPIISLPARKPPKLHQSRDRPGVEFNHNAHLALPAPRAVTAHPLAPGECGDGEGATGWASVRRRYRRTAIGSRAALLISGHSPTSIIRARSQAADRARAPAVWQPLRRASAGRSGSDIRAPHRSGRGFRRRATAPTSRRSVHRSRRTAKPATFDLATCAIRRAARHRQAPRPRP